MQAIEFDSMIQGQAIPLPNPGMLPSGQVVRVVVMYEETPEKGIAAARPDAISALAANPLVLSGFVPLTRDEAHER